MDKKVVILLLVCSMLSYAVLKYKGERDIYSKKFVSNNIVLYNVVGQYLIETEYSDESLAFVDRITAQHKLIVNIYYGVYLAHMENKNGVDAKRIVKYIPAEVLLSL